MNEPVDKTLFPVDALPPYLAEQVRRIAAFENVEESLPAAGFLGGASFAIGRGFDFALNEKSTPLPSNLWITPVAPSGSGKSTTVIPMEILTEIYKQQDEQWKSVTKPVLRAELMKLESLAEEYRRKKLWEQLKDANRDIYKKEKELAAGRPTWLVENFTPEALTAAFSCTGRTGYACIVGSEGRGITENLVSSYSDKSTESFWLSGWSRVDTSMRARLNFHLNDADGILDGGLQISAMFGLQPDKHEALMKPPFSISGWAQRRLFFVAQPTEYMSTSQSEKRAETLGLVRRDLTQWNQWVRSMVPTMLSNHGLRCYPTPEACVVLDDWYRHLNEKIQSGILGELESHARRWGEIACRIALVLHCMEHADKSATVSISADTMARGIEIMRWFANEMKLNYWRVELDSQKKKMETLERYARNKGERGFTMRDLNRAGIGTKNELLPIISFLVDRKRVVLLPTLVTPGKAGRRTIKWAHTEALKRAA